MDLSGFIAYDFSQKAPSISITNNGITFNIGVIRKLQEPGYVSLYINHKTREVVIAPSRSINQSSRKFFNAKSKKAKIVRWNNDALNIELYELIHPSKKLPEFYAYRVKGTMVSLDDGRSDGILFDMSQANEIK